MLYLLKEHNMKMQKFIDWFNTNQKSSRQEFVKNFKKLGWTEGAKFTAGLVIIKKNQFQKGSCSY